MRNDVLILLLFFIYTAGCSDKNNVHNDVNLELDSIGTVEFSPVRLPFDNPLHISFFSPLQGTQKGIAITLAKPGKEAPVQALTKINKCCNKTVPLIGNGNGPQEAFDIYASSKDYAGDSLFFYSFTNGKVLIFNEKLGYLSESRVKVRGGQNGFTYSNGKMFFAQRPKFNDGYIFTILDFENGNIHQALKARVPIGFEPKIRNYISAIASTPNGIAFVFMGDKKIQFMNLNGQVNEEIAFGNSDPIEGYYQIDDPMNAPSANIYIPKMEFFDGTLFVLLENKFIIVNYDDKSIRSKLVPQFKNTDDVKGISDFTIGDGKLFLRRGRNEIYFVEISDLF